jgi:hypothetical protein
VQSVAIEVENAEVGMNSALPQWYGHGNAAIQQIITTGTVAVDSNVLLDLYRVGREQREQILSALEAVSDRLFIPYQVALEYQRNRLKAASDNQRDYENLIENAVALAEQHLNRLHDRQHKAAVRQIFDEAREEIERKLREMYDEHVIPFDEVQIDDPIRKALDELIDDQAIGEPPSPENLKTLKEKALQRIADRIPPGYADAKDKGDPTGDCLIWFELLDHAAKSHRPLLFVTRDSKEDWYRDTIRGRSIGPRTELITEMRDASNGQLYHQVSLDFFLDLANTYLETEVEESTIEAVRGNSVSSQSESNLLSGLDDPSAQEALRAALESWSSPMALSDMLTRADVPTTSQIMREAQAQIAASAIDRVAFPTAQDIARDIRARFGADAITRSYLPSVQDIAKDMRARFGADAITRSYLPSVQDIAKDIQAQIGTRATIPAPRPAKKAASAAKKAAPAAKKAKQTSQKKAPPPNT